MAKQSAGILLFRKRSGRVEVLLVHPGGPFWAKKDAGSWSIPKGEVAPGEDELNSARREFQEETGVRIVGDGADLGVVRQKGGKTVHAWAFEGDCDPNAIKSNTFTMEWPPRSGRMQEFPEVDRAGFFDLTIASEKMHEGQKPLLERLAQSLGVELSTTTGPGTSIDKATTGQKSLF